ncbi:hypothetical protein L873DRAFT_1811648 [Choiromyces venosus 120613-1]|uniref:Uncharacterized protein n=1 Tax=Choiromyces venosus 120613-1 TaxID=1336337 RepID=A0A3N4JIL7_9PEZI|nr:hypothetical protein L873DRAFT_1811648 [Choiromyces venosus 120613-1]
MSHPSGGGLPRFISDSSMIPVLQTVNVIPVFQYSSLSDLMGNYYCQFINWVGIDFIRPGQTVPEESCLGSP